MPNLTRECRRERACGEGIEVHLGHVECEKPMRHSVGAFLKAGGYTDQEDRREVCTRVTGKFCACVHVCVVCTLITAVFGQVYLVLVPREPAWGWAGRPTSRSLTQETR